MTTDTGLHLLRREGKIPADALAAQPAPRPWRLHVSLVAIGLALGAGLMYLAMRGRYELTSIPSAAMMVRLDKHTGEVVALSINGRVVFQHPPRP